MLWKWDRRKKYEKLKRRTTHQILEADIVFFVDPGFSTLGNQHYLELFVIIRRSPTTSYLRDSLCSKFNVVATLILKVKETVSLPTIEVTVPLNEVSLFSRPPLNFWFDCLLGCFIKSYSTNCRYKISVDRIRASNILFSTSLALVSEPTPTKSRLVSCFYLRSVLMASWRSPGDVWESTVMSDFSSLPNLRLFYFPVCEYYQSLF